ncbi:hypothetical protein [Demequina aurantiaca]|uniref:hypothetical protein n=1 Tax=Demequina aurantiaca TaxID=676200 RepID=UPI003D34B204
MTAIINDNINVGINEIPDPSGQLLGLVHSQELYQQTTATNTDPIMTWMRTRAAVDPKIVCLVAQLGLNACCGVSTRLPEPRHSPYFTGKSLAV